MAAVQLIEVNTPKCVYAAFDNSRNNQNNIEETPDYNTYLQTVYGRENGIPGGCANDIAQTNDGILWIEPMVVYTGIMVQSLNGWMNMPLLRL